MKPGFVTYRSPDGITKMKFSPFPEGLRWGHPRPHPAPSRGARVAPAGGPGSRLGGPSPRLPRLDRVARGALDRGRGRITRERTTNGRVGGSSDVGGGVRYPPGPPLVHGSLVVGPPWSASTGGTGQLSVAAVGQRRALREMAGQLVPLLSRRPTEGATFEVRFVVTHGGGRSPRPPATTAV